MFRGILTRNNVAMLFYLTLTSLMILARSSGFSESIRYGGGTALGAIQSGLSGGVGSVRQLGSDFIRLWRMNIHYKKMQQHIQQYSYYEMEFHRLNLENERLRRRLGIPALMGYQQVHAQVVARDASNLSNVFSINKGSAAGIKPKMLVMAYSPEQELYGVVGRVQEVFAYRSTVVPLTQSNTFLAAQLIPSGYEGLITGGSWSGDELLLNYISRNALNNIAIGDLVVTSAIMQQQSEESEIISDLYIGEVVEVINDPTQVSLQIRLKSIIDLGRLDYVFVLIAEESTQWRLESELQAMEVGRVYQDYYDEQAASGLAYQAIDGEDMP
ncbi:rod shape-determining protein MreC [Entomospira culicis]|uniref:Cell shape-determining protein MreC n=1 Tax=Entomospira culicis TaxID=2719989 RepID=A0A968GDU8_9SPIO|nr:rod shape-determining protein MreC [Entomospira culicis]NIZ18523.1 rod shape-determining protein MreC [Entomospira culicis]NIZ68739.1 rod shape-determining protein MreC [Entomospira culicis]WDI37335.1 rod shape-determining protein MreC [Entomospira culicis]WDI38964.1 rod shape-determining protein MreC [Entomospira culicis]